MHKHYMDMLICPLCHGDLIWDIKDACENRIINAEVKCSICEEKYEVRDEIGVFLSSGLKRNDLWAKGEDELHKYLDANQELYQKLMHTPEEELNGADYWFKATYFEQQGDFEKSSQMFSTAFEKIYTEEYIAGWKSEMDYIINNVKGDKPIVDIASGKGYLVERLLQETNNHVLATDFSLNILLRNKEYFKAKGLYYKLSLMAFDARKTPFKDNSIWLMTSNMGLQNIEQSGEVISELHRITREKFMTVMYFLQKEDEVHLELMKEFGNGTYATRALASEVFNKLDWKVRIENSFMANIKPTPIGEILKGGGIDGFPIRDTKIEFCVVEGIKKIDRGIFINEQGYMLREWKPEDEEELAKIANNKKIYDNLRDGFPYPYSLEDARRFISSARNEMQDIYLAIEIEGKIAGSIGAFFKGDIYRKNVEIGYYIGEEFWGKGIMAKVIKSFSEHIFQNYDVIRIYAEPFARNLGSRRALEKSGFMLEGILRSNIIKNGNIEDSCIYSLLRALS